MRQGILLALTLLGAEGFLLSPVAIGEEQAKPWSQADEVWGEAEMAPSREHLQQSHGGARFTYVQAERFEFQGGGGEDRLVFDGNAWVGGDTNKLWFKSELEYLPEDGEFEEAEVQALWSRAVSPYFDFQAGLRHDFEPDGRTHLVAGFQGLAPYLFELDMAGFLSEQGDLTGRIEAEYELILTQRLILQPRVEVELAAQDIPELETGSGLTGLDAGVRLRYEVKREFAPYVGIEWQQSLGETADLAQASGHETGEAVFLIGLRAWY